jgi:hypothetical protein
MLKPPAPDPDLDPFREGIAAMRHDGKLAGYLASSVGTFWSPSRPLIRQWRVWFIVIWADGAREPRFEDYPPWTTVRELQSGTFTWDGGDAHRGEYAAEWLTEDDSEAVRSSLRIRPEDF